ncbi:MAG: DUF445 domain-containing protein [Gammaproteobacteria bacterium]
MPPTPQATPHKLTAKANDTGPGKMKFWATLWLVVAALLFVATTLLIELHPVFHYIRAFAEGALVGGLADWFAVTALFAHPLGLPIPHTAIIPRRKNEIGLRLGSFIQTHFLSASVVKAKLSDMKITERLLDWLASDKGSRTAVQQSASLIEWMLRSLEDEKIKQFISTHILDRLRHIEIAPILGDLLHILTANGKHSELFDKGVATASDLFEEYKPQLMDKIEQELPWWARILRGVAFRKVVKNIGQMLYEMQTDPAHESRQKFDALVNKLIDDLHNSPELRQKCEEIKVNLLQDPALQNYLRGLWQEIKPMLLAHCADPNSAVRQASVEWIQATTQALRKETDIMLRIERTFQILVSRSVQKYRHEMAQLITQEVERWDANTTSHLIETQIGSDLQWIRINGTLVGGLAGLLIYTISLGLATFNVGVP